MEKNINNLSDDPILSLWEIQTEQLSGYVILESILVQKGSVGKSDGMFIGN
jgi:hypothetical protein